MRVKSSSAIPAIGARAVKPRAAFARRLLSAINGWFERRRVLAELASLDDRSLADLQITRSDFHRIASGEYRRHRMGDRDAI